MGMGLAVAIAVAALGAVLVASYALFAATPELDRERVFETIRSRVDQGLTPGMILADIDGDDTTFFAYGHTAAGGSAIDADTVFEIGSITKAFVGILLAQMANEGLVGIDDPITAHLPEGAIVPERGGSPITMKHLATHTSGLPRMPEAFDPADPANPYADYGPEALLEALASAELLTTPGKQYLYSNFGAGLLGHILSRVANEDFESLLRSRVLEPLGMEDTAISMSDAMRGRLARGHATDEPTANWDFDALAGAGAVRSTARDMARFMAANLGLVETPLREALDTAMSPLADADFPGTRIGLGWHVTKLSRSQEAVWHNGGTGGYRAIAGFDRAAGRGVVILSNSATEVTDDIAMHWMHPASPLADLTPRTAIELGRSDLEAFAGTYRLAPGDAFEIELRGDRLHARMTGQGWLPIFPESATAFFYKAVDAQIIFERGTRGEVTGLVLHQGGAKQRAARVEE